MSKEIVNRVANSDIITVDLSDYIPKKPILELDIKQFLFEGFILKEVDFRASIKKFDFSIYQNKVVAVFCSSDCIIPMWAFMLVTAQLIDIASEIFSGNRKVVFQQLFLSNIENINTADFQNKKVIVKGCGQIPLKENLYISITKKLKKNVYSLMYGEACSAVPVYKKKKNL